MYILYTRGHQKHIYLEADEKEAASLSPTQEPQQHSHDHLLL